MWGTVCSDDYWDDADAGVVCTQLGFSRYGQTYTCYYSKHACMCEIVQFLGSFATSGWNEYALLALLHSVECSGSEESIFDCQTNEGDGGCSQGQDASVVCQGTNFIYAIVRNYMLMGSVIAEQLHNW